VEIENDDESESGEDSEGNVDAARDHYLDVAKSKLRKPKDVPLGPRYRGSRVSREVIDEDEADEDDPFERGFEEENSEEYDDDDDDDDDDDESDDERDDDEIEREEASDTDISDEGSTGPRLDQVLGASGNADLRSRMREQQKMVSSTLSQASKADAEKGRAVKKQRKAFDSLLGMRMKLQKALIAANTLVGLSPADMKFQEGDANGAMEAAETAAFNLWSSLNNFREELVASKTGVKRKRTKVLADMPTEGLWAQMQAQDDACFESRNATLAKWFSKTQDATAHVQSRRTLTGGDKKSTVMDVIQEHLSNSDRLLKRARTPRSCAPLQLAKRIEMDESIYDDADFYGLLLKELLEQKSQDSVSAATIDISFQMRRDAKTKKNVDTKASKGRKLRYTVHEKLQNFMAPEDRATWGERQTDELFGSLFGQRIRLDEGEGVEDVESDADEEETGLVMFRG